MNLPRITPARVYNVSVLVSVASVTAGVHELLGRGAALVCFGALVMILAASAAYLTRPR